MPGPFFYFFAIVALVTLATSVAFVARPAERTLAILRPLSAATVFSALASFTLGVTNGLAAMNRALDGARDPAAVEGVWRLARHGFAESPAPLILAFAVLSVVWLLVAAGLRRQA